MRAPAVEMRRRITGAPCNRLAHITWSARSVLLRRVQYALSQERIPATDARVVWDGGAICFRKRSCCNMILEPDAGSQTPPLARKIFGDGDIGHYPTSLRSCDEAIAASADWGSRTVNTEPLPSSLATTTSPPIMRASLREMARPSPVPP